MTLQTQTIGAFLDDLAGSRPTPGGGSAAAVIGATGAALVSMVCSVTLGKKGQEAVTAEMQDLLNASEGLRLQLTLMADEDIAAFDALMAAYRLPKTTDAERTLRARSIQASLRSATEAPLRCARASHAVITLARRAAKGGYSGVVSDAGVGVVAAHAALQSAALNVQINAPLLEDRAYAESATREMDALLIEGARDSATVFALVRGRLG
jgi:methenyltetrahydrofolate cyclohydrolase